MTAGGSASGRRPHSRPGLPAERTAMAWQRTALGVAGVSALLLRESGGRPVAVAPGVAGLLVALTLLAVAERRYARTLRRVAAGVTPASPVLVRTVTATALLLAAAALTLVLLPVS